MCVCVRNGTCRIQVNHTKMLELVFSRSSSRLSIHALFSFAPSLVPSSSPNPPLSRLTFDPKSGMPTGGRLSFFNRPGSDVWIAGSFGPSPGISILGRIDASPGVRRAGGSEGPASSRSGKSGSNNVGLGAGVADADAHGLRGVPSSGGWSHFAKGTSLTTRPGTIFLRMSLPLLCGADALFILFLNVCWSGASWRGGSGGPVEGLSDIFGLPDTFLGCGIWDTGGIGVWGTSGIGVLGTSDIGVLGTLSQNEVGVQCELRCQVSDAMT